MWKFLTYKSLFAFLAFLALTIKSGLIFTLIRQLSGGDVDNLKIIRAGQGITPVVGSFGLIWNLWTLIYGYWRRKDFYILASGIEFILGLLLLVGVGLQSSYLPHDVAVCDVYAEDDYSYGFTSSGTIDNALIFAVADLSNQDPSESCDSFMTVWILGIMLGIVSLFSAAGLLRTAKDPPNRFSSIWRLEYPDFILDLLYELTPSARIRYKIRYFKKWKHQDDPPPQLTERLNKKTFYPAADPSPPVPTKLTELLSNYPILTGITSGLCYMDLKSLSLTSKTIRETIFPHSNRHAASQLIQRRSCQGAKFNCWVCDIQLCSNCAQDEYLPETHTVTHLQHCKPYCDHCFLTQVCKASLTACSCDLQVDRSQFPTQIRQVCGICINEGDNNVQVGVRERREMLQIMNMSRVDESGSTPRNIHCEHCNRKLPDAGVRWWYCSFCRKECRLQLHQGWIKSEGTSKGKAISQLETVTVVPSS